MKIIEPISVLITNIARAIGRARSSILSVFCIYTLSILVGIVMVHAGNTFTLAYRDRLVDQAGQQDPAAQAASQGNRVQAALRDFSGNVVIGAIPKTLMGFGIIFPYPWVAYQGWVGGIVSVRGDHTSRFDAPRSAIYYSVTLLLQVLAYSVAVGAGVNVGVALFRPPKYYQGEKWLSLFPKEALRDVGRLYVLAVPLFLVASLWEFLSLWNL